MVQKKKNIDLSNLAFMLKEIIHQLEQLDEDEIETLEILLNDDIMEAIDEVEANPEFIPYEEFLKHDLSDTNKQKSPKTTSQVK